LKDNTATAAWPSADNAAGREGAMTREASTTSGADRLQQVVRNQLMT
jgi:hypothetical protein